MIKTKSAWLITQEPSSKNKKKVLAILNYRTADDKVRWFLEHIYTNYECGLIERLAYAKSKKNNPYPARFGASWNGMCCGNTPFFYARKVRNLEIKQDKNENNYLYWEETEKPNSDWIRKFT